MWRPRAQTPHKGLEPGASWLVYASIGTPFHHPDRDERTSAEPLSEIEEQAFRIMLLS
jgi:hypothetical protein